ncbi:MAG: gliding motility-associated C-terminal domain-containing protein [Candidatus Cyclobacteriaceae bacterium M2_1C_046]
MQIIVVSNCINKPPEIESFDRICVIAGEIIDEDILALDPDNDSISISVFSEVFSTKSSPATLDTISSKSLKFSWQTDCSHVRSTEYQVVFRVTDFPDDGQVSLTRYFTLRIKVIGPPPEILDITKEETALNLTWSPYTCQNASAIEIWRRVDSNNFLLENCATGMPTYSGYERIATVLASDQSFSDNDLIMGAKYCYRLLAIYDNINITESKVSEETCYEFIPAEAPVITNVSVKRTHYSLGEIDIRWMKPFDLDFTVFTGDIVYELYRSKNDESSFEFVKRLTNDTSFLDGGLNTADSIYYYRLLLKVPEILGEEVVDTSATASTVRLTASGAENKVDLAWGADVPWSNYIKDGYHLIYRTEGEAEFIEALDLIDSVRVTEDGFNYEDIGEYLNTPIDNTKTYCYAVMTRGTYGNPKIQSPLENFSQIHCIQPVDSIPPDAPVFVNSGTKCEDIGCTEFEFKNQLYWNNIESGVTYNIYYAPSTADSFLYLTTTKDTFYTDTPDNNARMISFAGCYKIEAIDRAGNVSGLSDVFCFDNCPRYELPNVFTPENNDQCNDLFTAFKVPEGNDIKCGVVDGSRCARFVKSVKFIVYNRWGKQVYNYESDPEKSIYINWNGMDSYAKPLPAGVYYYVAKVIFDVVNPDEAEQDIKGWVHILR